MLPCTMATPSVCSEPTDPEDPVSNAVKAGERSLGDQTRIRVTAPARTIPRRRAGAPPTTCVRVTLMRTTINDRPYTPATEAIGKSKLCRYCVYPRRIQGNLVSAKLRRGSEEHTSELQSPLNLVCR